MARMIEHKRISSLHIRCIEETEKRCCVCFDNISIRLRQDSFWLSLENWLRTPKMSVKFEAPLKRAQKYFKATRFKVLILRMGELVTCAGEIPVIKFLYQRQLCTWATKNVQDRRLYIKASQLTKNSTLLQIFSCQNVLAQHLGCLTDIYISFHRINYAVSSTNILSCENIFSYLWR